MDYKLAITLKSAVSPGSGQGWAGMIDSDIVFDELGVPFIPARRIKGVLRDNARDLIYALMHAHVPDQYSFTMGDEIPNNDLNLLFGKEGQEASAPLMIGNAYLEKYAEIQPWIKWAQQSFPEIVSRERVSLFFTSLRQQTAIDRNTDTALEHSLRITRVLKPGYTFISDIRLEIDNLDRFERLLALAVQVTRYLGSKRNRGLGSVECHLIKKGINLQTPTLNAYQPILLREVNNG